LSTGDMEPSSHMFYRLKNYLIFSDHKHIDNFPVPLEEIHYTLMDINDISITLTDKRLLI